MTGYEALVRYAEIESNIRRTREAMARQLSALYRRPIARPDCLRVKTTRRADAQGERIDRYNAAEAEYEAMRDEWVALQLAAVKWLATLPEPDATILEGKYIKRMTWAQIGRKLNYSRDKVRFTAYKYREREK